MIFNIEVDTSQAQREMGEYGRRVDRRLQEVLDVFALRMQRSMQINAPVDTGFLRSSITVFEDGRWVRVVGPTADYGIFVEMGTSRTRAQPFVEPAVLEHKAAFERAIREALR